MKSPLAPGILCESRTKKKILVIFALKHYIKRLNKMEQDEDIVPFSQ